MSHAQSRHATYARRNPATLLVFLGLGAIVIWFMVSRAHYFVMFSPASFNPYYWPRRWILLPHVAGGLTAISTGLVQLWLGLTGRTGNLHKALGRIYVFAIAVGVPAGLLLALSIPDHLDFKVGLLGLDLAWALTTSMGMLAIKRRDISQHRAWMMRSYTVTFGFATYRIIYSWIAPHVAMPHDNVADQMSVIMAWSCWSVPLLFMEVGMQLRSMRPARQKLARTKARPFGEPASREASLVVSTLRA
jgi:uncharacterized membrane protein